MSKKLFFALFALSTAALADVTVELEGKNYSCDRKSEIVFHCLQGAKKILIVKNFAGYSAIEKQGNELPVMKWVSKVTENKKTLFEIPKMNFPGMGTYKAPDSKASRLMNANGIVTNLKDLKDDLAVQLVKESRDYIDQEKTAKPKLKVLADNSSMDCERGQDKPLTAEEKSYELQYNTKLQCNFYACKNEKGEKILSYVPGQGEMASPYFVVLKGEKSELRFDGLKIVEPGSQDQTPLYDIPKSVYGSYGNGMPFDENLLIPSKFQKNKSAFNFFTTPATAFMREGVHKFCGGDNEVMRLIAEEAKTAELFQEELLKTNLSHYLTLVNGQMLSVYVNADKAKGIGCHYDGMILSKEAEKHIGYLQKAKPKPVEKFLTEDEVQELFLKAKNMPDIPFGYKYDGCYARAHVMARRFEAMGIPVEKVWIKGSLFVPGTDVQWNYHVAPVINVKTKNGEIKKYVIDPSLTEKAVTVDGWVASMGKNVKGGVVQTAYPFPVNVASFQRTAVAISSSDIYVPDNDEKRSEEENMAMAVQTMKEYSEALNGNKQQGDQNEYEQFENENQHIRPDTL